MSGNLQQILLLGPCAAETQQQVIETARQVAASFPNAIFRAGIWKPRTSPDTFQGIGKEGLKWLQQVQDEINLPCATEIANPEQTQLAIQAGIRHLWIGARTCADPQAVQAIADTVCAVQTQGITLYIKNPVNNDAALWIGNIYRLKHSAEHVFAIHRGCNHRPCWSMAYRLRQEMPDIPILLDPSHMSGDKSKIDALIQDADELQYNGLMVEVHCNPSHALSDAHQQLNMEELLHILRHHADMKSNPSHLDLSWLRHQIDEIDNAIWEQVEQRMAICEQIGEYKRRNNMVPLQPARFEEILSRCQQWGKDHNLSEDTISAIMSAIHTESLRHQ